MRRVGIGIVILAALGIAAQAVAGNYPVNLGEQARPPAGTPAGATLDAFLPSKVTINAGDTVTFSSATFHTVAYGKPSGLFIPDPAKTKYGPLDDAAGNPFYFVGLPKLIYNGAAFAPYGPRTVSGSTPLSSGILSPAGPKAKPATVTLSFPKAGSYKLFCTVHPGMTATVVVKPAGTPVPETPAQVKAQALQDTASAWAVAKQEAAAAKPPANTVDVGVGSASTLLAYLPKTLKVKVGTTVTFVNKSPTEVHDLVFGPQKYINAFEKKTDLLPTGPKAPNQVTPILPYGSEPKGHYTYDGTNHGNGFFATPLIADSPAIPLPHSSTVTFSKAGTYKFFCIIHGPDMAGTIAVTP